MSDSPAIDLSKLPKLPDGYEWKLKAETMDKVEYLALMCDDSELGYLLHRKAFDLPWDIILESADQFYGSRKTLDEAARELVRVAFPTLGLTPAPAGKRFTEEEIRTMMVNAWNDGCLYGTDDTECMPLASDFAALQHRDNWITAALAAAKNKEK